MKKWLIILFVTAGIFIYFYSCMAYWLLKPRFSAVKIDNVSFQEGPTGELAAVLERLRLRDDQGAWQRIERALKGNENNPEAVWARAELLRRKRNYPVSEEWFEKVLSVNPGHIPSLISLSYIKCKSGSFDEAESLIGKALDISRDKDNAALAYVSLGVLNAARARKGDILDKLRYAPQVKCYFEKAVELAPSLAEPHLALGTFYLFAPWILGGDLNKAIGELELAVNIAPDFAAANARLAECYKKKYDYVKYNLYMEAAKRFETDDEALKEADAW